MNRTRALVCAAVATAWGCGTDPRPRIDPDADIDADTDTDSDTETDSDSDSATDSDTDTGPACDATENCVDVEDPDAPICSPIGEPCRDARDCAAGFFCAPDANGWPGGSCLADCDPDLAGSCPAASRCVYGGEDGGVPVHLCLKACAITDRNPWDTSSCGCRDGYECDLLSRVCVPGCTMENLQDACCPPGVDCSADCNEDAYRCTNPGDPDANWGDGCVHDWDCPAEGRCLDGYCLRFGCDLDGRECDENGGPDATRDDCRNLGSTDDPAWLCVKTCNVTETDGADPFAANVECGEGYGCFPDAADPEAIHNGFCWAPSGASDVREENVGAPCEADADCWSPFGQGVCISGPGWTDGTCAVRACDFPGMEALCPEDDVCEPLGALSLCLDGCTDPGGGFGTAVGCRDDGWSCYPAGGGGGLCLPSCATQPDPDRFCGEFFVGAPNCDPSTGLCEP